MQPVPEAASPEAEGKPVSLRRIRSVAVAMTCVLLGWGTLVVVNGAENAGLIVFFLPFALPYMFILWRLRGGPEKSGLRLAMATGIVGFVVLSVLTLFLVVGITFILIGEGTETVRDVMILLAVILFSGTLAGLHWILRGDAKKAHEAAWPEEGRQRQLTWRLTLAWVFVVLVMLSLAVAIPNLLRSRIAAGEASPVGSMRSINTVAPTYSETYHNGYPPSLRALGPPPAGGKESCEFADLVDKVLASGNRSGYTFSYTPGLPVKNPAAGCPPGVETYTVSARPVTYGTTGERSFFMDQTGIIHVTAEDRAATPADPRIN
jgi:type IV pilus assembly protein PilA